MFMSYGVYFANWKRTKICVLLIKTVSLLISDFRPLSDLRSELPGYLQVLAIFEAVQSTLPGLMFAPGTVPVEVPHSSNQALHRKHSQISVH